MHSDTLSGLCVALHVQAGIQSLTETLALEGRATGVLAYCVVPTRTDTPLRRTLYPEENGEGCLKPWDVAEVIVSCATTANPLLTGQAFWLRGGGDGSGVGGGNR
jgi:NAD(P)-dependent dehydrogenase (short-subunit alcohol dehydrogenase family)